MTRLLVVGGHSRTIGKTALVVDLIHAFPQAGWLAVKITQYGHGVCAVKGASCNCAPRDHAAAMDEETSRAGKNDTSRFLAAGAERALWLRTKQGHLAEGLPLLRAELLKASHAIVESNSLMGFLDPDVYLIVVDPDVSDFKASAKQFLDRADAFVTRGPLPGEWTGVSPKLLERRPVFRQGLNAALPDDLIDFVRERVFRTF